MGFWPTALVSPAGQTPQTQVPCVISVCVCLQGNSAKMDSNTAATITLAGFLAALVHLAHARAAAAVAPGGGPNTAAYTQLSSKLESLLRNCMQPNIFPDIARRVSNCMLVPLHMYHVFFAWSVDTLSTPVRSLKTMLLKQLLPLHRLAEHWQRSILYCG